MNQFFTAEPTITSHSEDDPTRIGRGICIFSRSIGGCRFLRSLPLSGSLFASRWEPPHSCGGGALQRSENIRAQSLRLQPRKIGVLLCVTESFTLRCERNFHLHPHPQSPKAPASGTLRPAPRRSRASSLKQLPHHLCTHLRKNSVDAAIPSIHSPCAAPNFTEI